MRCGFEQTVSWCGETNEAVAMRRVMTGARSFVLCAAVCGAALGQAAQPSAQSATTTPGVTVGHGAKKPDMVRTPTEDDLLRGSYGPYRTNNDLLFYKLDVRVDPVAKTIAGSNTVRFRMLADGTRIQLELSQDLNIDGIELQTDGSARAAHGIPLKYTREERTVWVNFPRTLHKGRVYAVRFAYSGTPNDAGAVWMFLVR